MNIIKSPNSFKFLAFMLFMVSMGWWIGWGHKKEILALLGILTVFVCFIHRKKFNFSKQKIALCITFYFCYLYNSTGINTRVLFSQIPGILFPIVSIICLKDEYKQDVLSTITKWFAILLIPSVFIYAITSFIDIPSFGLITPVVDIKNSTSTYGYFYNYIFYVKQQYTISGLNRFSGPFTEPGHLGMIGAFLLMANKFDLKNKYNKIILACIAITLSLAGYILVIIAFLFTTYYNNKIKLRNTIFFTLSILMFVIIGQEYNEGNNIINEHILNRFESNEERGISGNNRATLFVMNLYQEMFSDPKLLLWGYSKEFKEIEADRLTHSNGYQFFIVMHGLIGFILAFVFYLWILLIAENKKFAVLFFLFVFICFLQRVYWTWIPWIICYEYAISNENLIYKNKKNDKLLIHNSTSQLSRITK